MYKYIKSILVVDNMIFYPTNKTQLYRKKQLLKRHIYSKYKFLKTCHKSFKMINTSDKFWFILVNYLFCFEGFTVSLMFLLYINT